MTAGRSPGRGVRPFTFSPDLWDDRPKMKKPRLSSHLRPLFIGAVILPAALLAFLAIRAINREEAFIGAQYSRAFSDELVHTVDLLTNELNRVRDELEKSAPAPGAGDPGASFARWKQAASLVRTPFLLSAQFEILWPRAGSSASEEEMAFIRRNGEFVRNRVNIPVYSSIADVYGPQIADLAQAASAGQASPSPPSGEVQAAKADVTLTAAPPVVNSTKKESEAKEAGPAQAVRSEKPASPEKEKLSTAPQAQQVVLDTEQTRKVRKDLEENTALREQVYQQARDRGLKLGARNVLPSAQQADSKKAQAPESLFISEPKRFGEIVAGRESGLIPRFLGEELNLFFWKKDPSGRIIGCVVDGRALRSRLAGQLPEVLSPSRVLTLLDESGRPLATPPGDAPRDWRRPFVAREVSELLPRWEAAVYLADPNLIRSRANATTVILWALVLTFLLSILGGGTLVLRTLRREMEMARQKTTFVTNVSHELKTPLTSIRMFAEMLKEGRQPDPRRRGEYLDLMVSESDRLTRLINNVLDFSRLEKGQKQYAPKLLELNRLARGLVQDQRLRMEANGFKVEFRPSDEPVFVMADEEALLQAALNLLSNAEKYSADSREVEVEVAAQGGQACLRVKDRGVGVSPAQAKKLFQEFFRADTSLTARTKGTGLGLSIARRLLRDQGGDVAYAPRPGGGSVFEIRLPRSESA